MLRDYPLYYDAIDEKLAMAGRLNLSEMLFLYLLNQYVEIFCIVD